VPGFAVGEGGHGREAVLNDPRQVVSGFGTSEAYVAVVTVPSVPIFTTQELTTSSP